MGNGSTQVNWNLYNESNRRKVMSDLADLVSELSQKAQTLAPADRARLAELLLDSIHQGASYEVESAWDEELQRRIEEVDRGVANLVSVEAAFAQVRRAIQ